MAGTSSFPRQHRLRSKVEFDGVFQGGLRSADPFFSVLARPNAIGHARLGLAIAKRSAKRAVDRNRLKRVTRETFRIQAALPALDFVVSARAAAVTQPLAVLRASLEQHLHKLVERCARS